MAAGDAGGRAAPLAGGVLAASGRSRLPGVPAARESHGELGESGRVGQGAVKGPRGLRLEREEAGLRREGAELRPAPAAPRFRSRIGF